MKKYDIHTDGSQAPAPEKIAAQRDFEGLMHRYQAEAPKLRLRKRLYRLAAGIGLASLLPLALLVWPDTPLPAPAPASENTPASAPETNPLPPDLGEEVTSLTLPEGLRLTAHSGGFRYRFWEPGDETLPASPVLGIDIMSNGPLSLVVPPQSGSLTVFRYDSLAKSWKKLPVAATQSLPEVPLPPKPRQPMRPFGVKLANPQAYPGFKGREITYWVYLPGEGSADPWESGLIGTGKGWEDVRLHSRKEEVYELRFARQGAGGQPEFRTVRARWLADIRTEAEMQALIQRQEAAYRDSLAAYERGSQPLRIDAQPIHLPGSGRYLVTH
ncbi:MAG: hypothetical protein EAZ89_17605 [Bacteroidetes bacterium]|nr:MAG: hypothetical protein EAZ89_17605 [Bacteroidota bacterium]